MDSSPLEILSPQLNWINGRCYRVNPTKEYNEKEPASSASITTENPPPYIEDGDFVYDDDDTETVDASGSAASNEYDIISIDSNRFKTAFHVANAFYGQIVGAKGTTKKRIESETKTVIKVPRPGSTDGNIEVFGSSRSGVATARRRIELLVIGTRHKQIFTHFISVPVAHQPTIRDRYRQFKQDIVGGPSIFGLSEAMFYDEKKLHLTIGPMALMDNHDRMRAGKLLRDSKQTIVQPLVDKFGPIEVHVIGLDYMNDDPSEVNVLYARIESDGLQLIADRLVDAFVVAGLMKRHHDRVNVKLHMTVINSRLATSEYKGGDVREQQKQQTKPSAFDARSILQKYSQFEFGRLILKELHLSRRHTVDGDGYYCATDVIKILS